MNNNQQGFTLIELMIALTLGLILVAVAIQLLVSGQTNYRIQQAASTVQDSGVFGLNAVTQNIRLANHGNAGAMNDQTLYGGVVLSAQTTSGLTTTPPTPAPNGNLNGLRVGTTLLSGDAFISKNAYQESAFGTVKSDQLVIIYQAPVNMLTCTGRRVKGPDRSLSNLTKGWYVVERYYIKKKENSAESDLYCSDALFLARGEAGGQTYNHGGTPSSTTLSNTEVLNVNYGTAAGQMIAPNVEYMRVQLLVRHRNQNTSVMDINEYTSLGVTATQPNRPAIIGINLGWLVRSNERVANAERTTYTVLDRTLTAPSDKYMRHVYNTTVALRNGGLGEVIQ